MNYTLRYWVLEESLPIGEAGDNMASLECEGHIVTTVNADHVLWEHLDNCGWFK